MRLWISAALVVACSSTPKVYGPTFDGGDDASSDAASDASIKDASADATPSDASTDSPSCTSTIAILGGNATSLFAGSGLAASSVSGDVHDCGNDFGCANPLAVVRSGSELVAVFARSTGALQSTTYQTSWAAPANIASASTIDGPSLAVIGQTTHLVFQGADYKYLHAEYTSTAWDSAADPVGGSGPSQSYGARTASAAAAGTDLVIVQAGSDSYLYDQTWNGSWQAAHQQGGAAIQNTLPPSITALTGGASELLAVYLRESDYKVMATDRKSGTWNTTPTLIDANAYSNDPVAVGALPGGKALVVFRGSNKQPYFSTWDGASTWTAPVAALGASNPMIESVPSIATGVCGADAIVAWAETGGGVTTLAFSSGTFTKLGAVSGTSGAKFVAVGTLP